MNEQGNASFPSVDPTYRVGGLCAANIPPLSIKPDAPLAEAITLMLSNRFSQLPVMTTEREVKGVVSWSSVGMRFALGRPGDRVRDMMDQHQEVHSDTPLIMAIPTIAENQYVLVRSATDNRISGIVTATDLSMQFHQLAEPFLLLGGIEHHLRRIIAAKFAPDELAACRNMAEGGRPINRAEDLTFAEYLTLLGNSDRWAKLKLSVDRHAFCAQLARIREIRNAVMHFDPKGIDAADLERLRDFAYFLERLHALGAS